MAIGLAILSFFSYCEANESTRITLRTTSALLDAAIKLIAEEGEPTLEFIQKDTKVTEVIRKKCGVQTNTYVAMAIAENKKRGKTFTVDTASEPRQLYLPACAKWSSGANGSGIPVFVREGDSVETISQRHIGISANAVLAPCVRPGQPQRCGKTVLELIASLNGFPIDKVKERVQPRTTIRLPIETFPVDIFLRIPPGEEPTMYKAKFLSRLEALSKSADAPGGQGTPHCSLLSLPRT